MTAMEEHAARVPGGRRPEDMPAIIGAMCRCMVCCCRPGQGHNSPGWKEWEAREREAREEASLFGLVPHRLDIPPELLGE